MGVWREYSTPLFFYGNLVSLKALNRAPFLFMDDILFTQIDSLMILKTLATLAIGTVVAASASAQTIPSTFEKVREVGGITEYKHTGNGLTVLLMEDRSAPVVTVMITYLVGSRNEVTGTTGATHLLEHLMFKGTDKYNRAAGTGMDAMLQNRGALLNATTWLDRTNYYQNLPAEHMELALDIEADRMRNLWLREEDRQPEMTVVRNEFEIGENNPIQSLSKDIVATAIQAHPYHHSTIGWRSDIEGVSIEKLREFYDTFYWPNNATLTVIGDFKTADALKLVEQYYGVIPRSPNPIPTVYTTEPQQRGPRRVQVKRAGQVGVVGIAFKTPEGRHPDAAAVTVMADILASGRTSRLYRGLVDKGLVNSVSMGFTRFRDPYLTTVNAVLNPGGSHQSVEDSIWTHIHEFKANGVTQEEVDRAVNRYLTRTAFSRDGSFSIAGGLNEAIALGDWTTFVKFSDEIKAVTPEDVKRVANQYLVEDQTTTGWFIPQVPGGMARPARGANSWQEQADSPFYYRDPSEEESAAGSEFGDKVFQATQGSAIAPNVVSRNVGDIRVLSLKTSVQDVVTLTGSFAAGSTLNPAGNTLVAALTAQMLDKGTTSRDKLAIATALENIGASINFSGGTHTLNFSARFLKKDMDLVLELLAEQLRSPKFDEAELARLKVQLNGALRRQLDDPGSMASSAMSRLLFPKGHPNYTDSVETTMAHLEAITIADLKAFHSAYYGPKSMVIVAVGDVDSRAFQQAVQTRFRGWRGGVTIPKFALKGTAIPARDEVVFMPDKTSATYRVGIPIGIGSTHPDFLPLYIGAYVLGGNFSARLMSTVRDQEGLTYGISSAIAGASAFADGLFITQASFSPQLVERGAESTQRQLKLWIESGITQAELDAKKSTIAGMHQVQLATTSGLAGSILNYAQDGRGVKYIDQYVVDVNAVTLEQVNNAIRRYIRPENLVVVTAGTVERK